jgi:membrane-associated phospholipid phosphatase
MYNILKHNKLFLVTYSVLLVAGLLPVLIYTKTDVHLFINQFHSAFCDVFFKYITNLGSGVTVVIVSIILLFISIRYSLIMLASWAGEGIVVQFLKHIVFPDIDRPVSFFKTVAELHLVQDIELYNHFSFPSGHAATAFVIFTTLAIISKRNWVKLCLLFSAWIIAFSRVYLSQHFLEDILFGSLLGILAVIIFYWYFHRWKIPWADQPVQFYLRSESQ